MPSGKLCNRPTAMKLPGSSSLFLYWLCWFCLESTISEIFFTGFKTIINIKISRETSELGELGWSTMLLRVLEAVTVASSLVTNGNCYLWDKVVTWSIGHVSWNQLIWFILYTIGLSWNTFTTLNSLAWQIVTIIILSGASTYQYCHYHGINITRYHENIYFTIHYFATSFTYTQRL